LHTLSTCSACFFFSFFLFFFFKWDSGVEHMLMKQALYCLSLQSIFALVILEMGVS
jgi:hypothetical protein